MNVLLGARFLHGHQTWFQEQLGSDTSVETADWDDFEDFATKVRRAHVVVSYRWNAAAGKHALQLKLLHNSGAGMYKIDVAAVPSGAFVANCYEHERAVGEFVLMACLALSRSLLAGSAAPHRRLGDVPHVRTSVLL